MKCTGIVRRIDDMGRIVIPKEIRRQLSIKETDSMAIFTDTEGNIILKKYNPNLEDYLVEFGEKVVEYGNCDAEQLDEIHKYLKEIKKLLKDNNE